MKNVLIIGAGGIGRRHIKGYLSTNRVFLSTVEPDDEKNTWLRCVGATEAIFSDKATTGG